MADVDSGTEVSVVWRTIDFFLQGQNPLDSRQSSRLSRLLPPGLVFATNHVRPNLRLGMLSYENVKKTSTQGTPP